ncbi:MAG: lysozyme [Rhodanobacter sp.]
MSTPSSAIPATLGNRLKGLVSALAILMALLGYFEGDKLTAYRDIGGVPTICRGHTAGVHMGEVVTEEQCTTMDTTEAIASLVVVDRAIPGTQPAKRRAALADFEYNVGSGAFLRSTVLRDIKAGDIRGGCDFLSKYVYVGDKIVPWQVKRRAIERELCLDGLDD